MNALTMLNRGINAAAMLLCAGLAFIVIYCVCFCLYAALAVGMDCVNVGVGQCIADVIRAPFFLLLGPLSSVEGNPPPSPHPQILAIALTVSIALTVIGYLAKRRREHIR